MNYWNKHGKTGHFFFVDMMDEKGTSIRGVAYGDVADRLFPLLLEDKVPHSFSCEPQHAHHPNSSQVHYVTSGMLKVANKKYSHVEHDYEISFDNSTHIELVDSLKEDVTGFPRPQPKFKTIAQVMSMTHETVIGNFGFFLLCEVLFKNICRFHWGGEACWSSHLHHCSHYGE